ncbi:hypothetical protein F4604DRAFT_1937249 [Suillus subluteus]|nr:hypothetical protein F4604DRAFT_1937249 [Suillus subluteus]
MASTLVKRSCIPERTNKNQYTAYIVNFGVTLHGTVKLHVTLVACAGKITAQLNAMHTAPITVWDRKCLEFKSKCAGIDAKHPENSMPYFPTDDLWTQVMLPPQPAPYCKPAPPPPVECPHPNLRQTNIPFKLQHPTGGYHARGAPFCPGHRGFRMPTSTGLNTIPITSTGPWDPNAELQAPKNILPPSTPTSSLVDITSFITPSSSAAPWSPSPPNV